MARRDDDDPYAARRRFGVMLGFGTQHPNDVTAWSRSLVKAFYSRGQVLCTACPRPPTALAIDTEPDTRCAACGRCVTDAQQKGAA